MKIEATLDASTIEQIGRTLRVMENERGVECLDLGVCLLEKKSKTKN